MGEEQDQIMEVFSNGDGIRYTNGTVSQNLIVGSTIFLHKI